MRKRLSRIWPRKKKGITDPGIGPGHSSSRARIQCLSVLSRFHAVLLITGLLAIGLMPSCAGTGDRGKAPAPVGSADAPDWALTGNTPDPKGTLCAVGMAGPTFFRFDAVETACDSARNALARSLRVKIQTTSLDIQTSESGMKDTQMVMEVASYVNELVLEGSRIEEVWFDEHGKGFARKKNYTYALACIDESAVSAGPGLP
jgi:hypothetical protein